MLRKIDLFESEEKVHLKPLPKTRWEPMQWQVCEVGRDWRVRFDCSFYAVPYQLIGKKVEICATSTLVRIFHENEEIVFYERSTQKWEYKRKAAYAPPFKEEVLQCSREGLLALAQELGKFIYELSLKILSEPTTDKLRPVRYLLNLKSTYSKERLEKACKRAFECKLFSYASVKNILIKKLDFESDKESHEKPTKNPQQELSRFERDPKSYKSPYQESLVKAAGLNVEENTPRRYGKEDYQDYLEKTQSVSKHGNAMWGAEIMMALDREDDERKKQGLKTKWEILQENYAQHATKEKEIKEPPTEAQENAKTPF